MGGDCLRYTRHVTLTGLAKKDWMAATALLHIAVDKAFIFLLLPRGYCWLARFLDEFLQEINDER